MLFHLKLISFFSLSVNVLLIYMYIRISNMKQYLPCEIKKLKMTMI